MSSPSSDKTLQRYRRWYGLLLRLYPRQYQQRFAEGMQQVCNDLLRERMQTGGSVLACVLWLCFETSIGILRENSRLMYIQHKKILRVLLVTACILLIPAVGTQTVEGWNWSLFDFVVASILLIGTGLLYELAASQNGAISYRLAAGIGVGTGLLLLWINGAVGIIGSENNPANLLYLAVIAIGLAGAALARLRPAGMARTLFAMALAQALVPVIAVLVWRPGFSPGVLAVFALNTVFVLLFICSALLFRRAGNRDWQSGTTV